MCSSFFQAIPVFNSSSLNKKKSTRLSACCRAHLEKGCRKNQVFLVATITHNIKSEKSWRDGITVLKWSQKSAVLLSLVDILIRSVIDPSLSDLWCLKKKKKFLQADIIYSANIVHCYCCYYSPSSFISVSPCEHTYTVNNSYKQYFNWLILLWYKGSPQLFFFIILFFLYFCFILFFGLHTVYFAFSETITLQH